MKILGNNQSKNRFWELDFLRGVAIVSMIFIHSVYDLMYFNIIPGSIGSEPWASFSFTTAATFLILVGISFSISYAKRSDGKGFFDTYKYYLKRGLIIFSGGLLITIVTLYMLPSGFIIFGILHLIGISIIIAPLFYNLGKKLLPIGISFILIGIAFQFFSGPCLLLPLGIHPVDFISYDYEPLFPWFGIVLIGIYFGIMLYPKGRRTFNIPDSKSMLSNFLCALGRNSLLIYMIHQPIIWGIIYIVFLR